MLLSRAEHSSNWTYILVKTNVYHQHTAQTFCRSLTTLILMGQMTDILVILWSRNFHLCSCYISFAHLDGMCFAVTHAENGYYMVMIAEED